MTWTVTVGGQTFSNSNLDGTAYADEAAGFPALLAAFASEADFLKGIGNTSTTSFTPSVTTQTLTLDQSPGFSVGVLVCAKSASDAAHYILGPIAAVNGNDIDITVTIANGGAAKADWVVTYPVPGIPDPLIDGNGDLAVPEGSLSAGAPDADWGAGGNRAFMDTDGASNIRIGSVDGGGAPTTVGFYRHASQIFNVDTGDTLYVNVSRRIAIGAEYGVYDMGTLSAGPYLFFSNIHEVVVAELAGDITMDIKDPMTGYARSISFYLKNDATGGWTPTFIHQGVADNNMSWPTGEPNWPSFGPGAVIGVVAELVDGWCYLSSRKDMRS